MSGANPRAHPSPMDVLRHAIGVVTELGKEAAAELCDRIEAVVRAYDEANTLDDWLAADLAETELGDWAVGVLTEDDTIGVDLGLPNPYADALRFPSIAGEHPAAARQQPRPASSVSYALPARRFERAMDRLFAHSGSPEAHAEMDAASDAMRMPPSIFEAPIVAARAKAHARLGLEREEAAKGAASASRSAAQGVVVMRAKPKAGKAASKRPKRESLDEFEKPKIELHELARAVYDDRISATDRRRRASEIGKGIKDLRERLAHGEVRA